MPFKDAEQRRAYHAQYRERNLSRIKSRQSEWYQSNKGRLRDAERAADRAGQQVVALTALAVVGHTLKGGRA